MGVSVSLVVKIIKNILMLALIAIVGLVLYQRVNHQVPNILGRYFMIVQTPSMYPKLKIGDVIVAKKVDPKTLKKGDIITYYGEVGSYAGKYITHKIVKKPVVENGKLTFQTQGILKGALLDPPITSEQILAKYSFTFYLATWIINFTSNVYGFIIVIVIPLITILVMQIRSLFKE